MAKGWLNQVKWPGRWTRVRSRDTAGPCIIVMAVTNTRMSWHRRNHYLELGHTVAVQKFVLTTIWIWTDHWACLYVILLLHTCCATLFQHYIIIVQVQKKWALCRSNVLCLDATCSLSWCMHERVRTQKSPRNHVSVHLAGIPMWVKEWRWLWSCEHLQATISGGQHTKCKSWTSTICQCENQWSRILTLSSTTQSVP